MGFLLLCVVTANFSRLSKSLLDSTSEAIPHHQGAQLLFKYQSLLKSAPPFASATVAIVSGLPANHIAGFAGMQNLALMHPAVVAPKCFRSTAGTVAPISSAGATSLWCKVAASHRFGELFVGRR